MSQSPAREPYNPFYLLFLLASLGFVVTALAYTFVPILEEKARDRGALVPESDFRRALGEQGWLWLLYEVAVMIVLGLASMGLDRLRRWQKERAQGTLKPDASSPKP